MNSIAPLVNVAQQRSTRLYRKTELANLLIISGHLVPVISFEVWWRESAILLTYEFTSLLLWKWTLYCREFSLFLVDHYSVGPLSAAEESSAPQVGAVTLTLVLASISAGILFTLGIVFAWRNRRIWACWSLSTSPDASNKSALAKHIVDRAGPNAGSDQEGRSRAAAGRAQDQSSTGCETGPALNRMCEQLAFCPGSSHKAPAVVSPLLAPTLASSTPQPQHCPHRSGSGAGDPKYYYTPTIPRSRTSLPSARTITCRASPLETCANYEHVDVDRKERNRMQRIGSHVPPLSQVAICRSTSVNLFKNRDLNSNRKSTILPYEYNCYCSKGIDLLVEDTSSISWCVRLHLLLSIL